MLRLAPFLLVFALTVFCLIDAATTPSDQVRNLPKWAWLLLIIVFDLIGSIAWLLAGHPWGGSPGRVAGWPGSQATGPRRGGPGPPAPRRTMAPDDDPAFLGQLDRSNREHEDLLRQWEQDLRRREEELRGPDDTDPSARPDSA